jgi:hypothetical protein
MKSHTKRITSTGFGMFIYLCTYYLSPYSGVVCVVSTLDLAFQVFRRLSWKEKDVLRYFLSPVVPGLAIFFLMLVTGKWRKTAIMMSYFNAPSTIHFMNNHLSETLSSPEFKFTPLQFGLVLTANSVLILIFAIVVKGLEVSIGPSTTRYLLAVVLTAGIVYVLPTSEPK